MKIWQSSDIVILQQYEIFFSLGIQLTFEGKAYVHWTERHGSGKNRRTRHYSATEIYFNQDVLLHGICNNDLIFYNL